MESRRAAERTTRSSTIQTSSKKTASSERDGASDTERRRERSPIPIDRRQLDDIVQYVKEQRTATVLMQEKLDILLLQAKLRREHHEQMAKAPNDRRIKPARVTARVAGLLNRQKELVEKMWGDYWNGVSQQAARAPANYLPKPTSMPRVHAVATLVQTFVRQQRSLRQRTTAKDIRELLAIHGYMSIHGESNMELSSSLRSAQRYLKFLSYKRGSKKGGVSYRLRGENQRKRDEYVSLMRAVNTKQMQRVVYLDESYIHHNYTRHDDSLFDPNDEQDINITVRHKGRRFCFIAAILDCDCSAPEDQRNEAQRSQLLHESIDVFEGGKKQTKDYHGMFNGPYFEQWMAKLTAALASRGIQNAIIALDNAKYHKRLPEGTPKGTTPKKEMQARCDEYSVSFEPHELKGVLWAKLKEHVQRTVKPVVVQMAEREGHSVIFTPPHHSNLQSIEIVWAIVKGEVGCQYTVDTTFQEVRSRLDRAFENLSSSTIDECIRKANSNLDALYREIKAIDDAEDDDSQCSDSESSIASTVDDDS